jgi:hypothetical protein
VSSSRENSLRRPIRELMLPPLHAPARCHVYVVRRFCARRVASATSQLAQRVATLGWAAQAFGRIPPEFAGGAHINIPAATLGRLVISRAVGLTDDAFPRGLRP